jgi:hypothetical protein
MPTLELKQEKNIQANIYLLSFDPQKRSFDAVDLDLGMIFSVNAPKKIDISQIEKGKKYQITIKVSKAGNTPVIENDWFKMSQNGIDFLKRLNAMKSSDLKEMIKFDLFSLKTY